MGFRSNTTKTTDIFELGTRDDFELLPLNDYDAGRIPAGNLSELMGMSTALTGGEVLPPSDGGSGFTANNPLDDYSKDMDKANKLRAGASVAGAVLNFASAISNASNAYKQQTREINMRMLQVERQKAEVNQQGRSLVSQELVEGQEAGKSAMLKLAAQGVDIKSVGATNLKEGYEKVAQFNAAQQEINMYRRLYGLDQSNAQLQYAKGIAKSQKTAKQAEAIQNLAVNIGMNSLVLSKKKKEE